MLFVIDDRDFKAKVAQVRRRRPDGEGFATYESRLKLSRR